MTTTDHTHGGWALTLTCPCSATATYRGVVPGLVDDAAARDGWWVESPTWTAHTRSSDGICGPCQHAETTRRTA